MRFKIPFKSFCEKYNIIPKFTLAVIKETELYQVENDTEYIIIDGEPLEEYETKEPIEEVKALEEKIKALESENQEKSEKLISFNEKIMELLEKQIQLTNQAQQLQALSTQKPRQKGFFKRLLEKNKEV